jgi:hypothetical protein
MPKLFEEKGLSKWYRKDLHVMVEKYFNKFYSSDMVRISKQEAFPKLKS